MEDIEKSLVTPTREQMDKSRISDIPQKTDLFLFDKSMAWENGQEVPLFYQSYLREIPSAMSGCCLNADSHISAV